MTAPDQVAIAYSKNPCRRGPSTYETGSKLPRARRPTAAGRLYRVSGLIHGSIPAIAGNMPKGTKCQVCTTSGWVGWHVSVRFSVGYEALRKLGGAHAEKTCRFLFVRRNRTAPRTQVDCDRL
jgi:hypothetical protein